MRSGDFAFLCLEWVVTQHPVGFPSMVGVEKGRTWSSQGPRKPKQDSDIIKTNFLIRTQRLRKGKRLA